MFFVLICYLCFPSYDAQGRLKALRKRAVDPTLRIQKYDQRGSDRRWAYHLPGDSTSKKIILVEGAIDAISVLCMANLKHRQGYFRTPVMATGGSPSSQWIQQCRYFKDMTVFIAFDSDQAGKQMTEKLLQQLKKVKNKAVVITGEGKDPNEWWMNLRRKHC